VCFSPGNGQWRVPDILGPHPATPQAYHTTAAPLFQSAPSSSSTPTWDNSALIAALNSLALQQGGWVMDSGASSHITNDDGNFSSSVTLSPPYFVTIGNDSNIPIASSGHVTFSSPTGHSFKLNNVLHVPHLIRNLLSIRKFTLDNSCTIEFDTFGFSMKDLKTRRVILRCNSDRDLYTFPGTVFHRHSRHRHASTASGDLWHQHLGHPGHDAMSPLQCLEFIKCNKVCRPYVCHACQLGKHVRLPFSLSTIASSAIFDLIHCNLWTSPIISNSCFQYYLVIVDDYSHYYWTFPLRTKSDVAITLVNFLA
jgi:hypothetical protein